MSFSKIIAVILLAIFANAAIAAEILTLPRKFGALSLGMPAAEFGNVTGVDPGGRCADCLPLQNGGDVEPELVAPLISRFSTLIRYRRPADPLPTIFFYKDRLEFALIILEEYDYTAVKADFERVLGKKYKRDIFPKKCIYAGGESLTWSDAATTIVLTEYRDKTGNQLEVKFADRALLEEAERLQDVQEKENIAKLEKEGNCPN